MREMQQLPVGVRSAEPVANVSIVHTQNVPGGRTILLVGPPHSVSSAFIAAVEYEFRPLNFVMAESVGEVASFAQLQIDLVLISEDLLEGFDALSRGIRAWHPDVPFAAIGEFRRAAGGPVHALLEERSIKGVLQQSVNLEILLSSIRILLRGGDYVPLSLFARTAPRPAGDGRETQFAGEAVAGLTVREREILAKVAKGNQNKTIAYDLGLSEHTIKVHLHKIIRKMGVHNRTEAAALFRDGLEGK